MPAVETSQATVVRWLTKEGWALDRHGANHDVYAHPAKARVILVPRHRTLSPGVARSIAKAAGWL